jgi:transaldolase
LNFAGIPVNVTLLFSHDHYIAAAEAYMRGIERRIAAGLNPAVHSVASIFVSRWDKAVEGKVPAELHDRLGIAVAGRTYKAYRALLDTDRWLRLENAGARPQRLLWASTGTKNPEASDVLYIKALAAPHTVNTMPEQTPLAFAEHGEVGDMLAADSGKAEELLARFAQAGIEYAVLAAKLQSEGTESFDASWNDLMGCIASKSNSLKKRVAL